MIKANHIELNRKSGIKLANSARAHIGGEGLNFLQRKNDSEVDLKVSAEEFTSEYE